MPKRTDQNQRAIVEALRSAGCSVQSLHAVGAGCPDLLVGQMAHDGERRNVLLEVKSGTRGVSRKQAEWHLSWRGQVTIVRTARQALKAAGIIAKRQ